MFSTPSSQTQDCTLSSFPYQEEKFLFPTFRPLRHLFGVLLITLIHSVSCASKEEPVLWDSGTAEDGPQSLLGEAHGIRDKGSDFHRSH